MRLGTCWPLAPRHLAITAMLVLAFLSRDGAAFHATFDYLFDRVEIDGNTFGPFDGSPDFVDDFDGGNIAPWVQSWGTIAEMGGAMHLRSPGTHDSVLGLDRSDAGISGSPFVSGAGSFRASARLPMVLPAVNQQVVFAFGDIEVFAISVQPNSVVQVYFMSTILDAQVQPISSPELTGDIVLQISYDDVSKEVSSAFSLDGGASFQTPFTAHTFNLTPSGTFILHADQVLSVCGDGFIVSGEACDDGNVSNGDGCDGSCVVEAGCTCMGEPSMCTCITTTTTATTSTTTTLPPPRDITGTWTVAI